MKRLQRLISKRGSVLFLVLVVMSLLIIAASATYYIINNQMGSITVRYSSEQSYETAKSMSNAVSKYVGGYLKAIQESGEKEISKYKNTVVGKMLQGQTITTKDMNLKELGLAENDFSKVNITIKPSGTKTKGDNTVNYYNIEVYSEFNGESTKITQVIAIETGPMEYFTRFLTSTGNRSEDVVVRAKQILSGAYFENDFTRLENAHMNDSVYVTGTFDDKGVIYHKSSFGSSTEIVISKNFYCQGADGSAMDVNDIYVGGDFECGKQILAENVYVMGDYTCRMNQGSSTSNIYVDGDCCLESGAPNQKFYINGDLYIKNQSEPQGEFHVKGNVIIANDVSTATKGIDCGGKFLYEDGTEVDPGDGQSWSGEAAPTHWYTEFKFSHDDGYVSAFDESKIIDAENYIASKTSKNNYKEWDAEGYFNKYYSSSPTITPDSEEYKKEGWDNYTVNITESCKLVPAKTWSWGNHNIEIDATDDDIYIYLDSNGYTCDGRKSFSFSESDNSPINVVVKGTHSVIFVLPEDTDFQFSTNTYVGHVGLAEYMADKTEDELKTITIRDYFKENDETTDKLMALFTAGDDDAEIIDRSMLSDTQTHNNIFFVTKGTQNKVSVGSESTLCGYIYAPNSVLTCDEPGLTIGFVGGLIMGSYTYKNMNATLAFTTPYDYDGNYGGTKKTDIVKQLMKIASDGAPGANSASEFKGFEILGYK